MRKELWLKHLRIGGPHDPDCCEACRARRQTRRENLDRQCRAEKTHKELTDPHGRKVR